MCSSVTNRSRAPAEVLVGELDARRQGLHLPHPVGHPRDAGGVVGRLAPHCRTGRCRCRPRRCRPCPGGRVRVCGPGCQFIHSMCDGAEGIVSAMRRMPGQQLVDRSVRPHVVGRVAVLVGIDRVRAGVEVRHRSPARWAARSWPGPHRTGLEHRQCAPAASSSDRASTGPVTAISISPSSSGGPAASAPSARDTRGPISCAQRNTSSSTSIGIEIDAVGDHLRLRVQAQVKPRDHPEEARSRSARGPEQVGVLARRRRARARPRR